MKRPCLVNSIQWHSVIRSDTSSCPRGPDINSLKSAQVTSLFKDLHLWDFAPSVLANKSLEACQRRPKSSYCIIRWRVGESAEQALIHLLHNYSCTSCHEHFLSPISCVKYLLKACVIGEESTTYSLLLCIVVADSSSVKGVTAMFWQVHFSGQSYCIFDELCFTMASSWADNLSKADVSVLMNSCSECKVLLFSLQFCFPSAK